ncbi:MAG: Ig-like domain-containing protein [Bacteroidales bacterium]|nr:Ig-like domain-containing protein [Bacteroidales bacterium]
MEEARKTTIYSQLESGVSGGYVTDYTQVKDVNMSDVTISELNKMRGSNALTPGHKYRITDPFNVTNGEFEGVETSCLQDGSIVVEALNGYNLKSYTVNIRYQDLYRLAKDGRLCTGTKYRVTDYNECILTANEIMPGVSIIKERSGTASHIIVEALDSWTLSDKAKYVINIQGELHYFDCTYKMGVSVGERRSYPWCYGSSASIVSSRKVRQDDRVYDVCDIQTNTASTISIYMIGTESSVPNLSENNLFEFYTEDEPLIKPTRRVGDYLYDCWGYHKGIVTWLKDDLENEAPFDFYFFAFDIINEELLELFNGGVGYQYPLFMSGTGSSVYNPLKTEYRVNYYHNVFKSILPIILWTGHDCCFDNTVGLIETAYSVKAVNSKVRLERTNDFDVKDGAVRGSFYHTTIQGDGKKVWAHNNLYEGTYIQIEDQLINIEDLKHDSALPVFYSNLYEMAVRGTLVPGRRYLIRDGGTMPTLPDMLIRMTGTFLYGIVVTARDTRSFFEDVELVYNKEIAQSYSYIDFSKFKAKYDFFGLVHCPFWLFPGLKPYFANPLPYNTSVLNTLPDGTFIISVSINTVDYTSIDIPLDYTIYTDSRDLTLCTGWGFYDPSKGYVSGSYTASGCEYLDSKGNPLYERPQGDLFIYLLSSYRGSIYEFEDDLGNRAEFDFYNNLLKNPGLISDEKPSDPNVFNLLNSESYTYLPLFADYDGNHVLLDPTYREYYKNNKIINEQPTNIFIGREFNNVFIEDSSVILSGSVDQTVLFRTGGYIAYCECSKFIGSTVNVINVTNAEINHSSITNDLAHIPCTLYNVVSEYSNLSINNTNRYTLYGNNVNIGGTLITIDSDGIYNINSDLTVTKLGVTKSQPVLELGNGTFNLDSIGDISEGQRVTFKLVNGQNVSSFSNGYGFYFRFTCTQKETRVGNVLIKPSQTGTIYIVFIGKSKNYINGTKGTYFDAILDQNTFIPIDAGNDTIYSKVTATSNGLMSKEDKIKLDTYPDIADVLMNYDLNVKAINHRGYSLEAPENTIPAYILSKKKGFTYVEGDVSFTSDSVAVLLHDATIDRTSDGSGDITSLSYQKVLQYDFGSWMSEEYAGTRIPTFKEWMICCKNLGLHPYIELKSAGGYTQSQINQVVAEVEECGMKGKVTYISFSNTYLGYVKNADSYARLGLLANPLNTSKINQAKALRSGNNEVFLDAKLSTVTSSLISTLINEDLPLEVWTVNTEDEIKNMPTYISGVTSDGLVAGKILYENALIYVPPVSTYIPTTSITIDHESLTFTDKNTVGLTASVEPSDASEPVVWSSSDNNVATVTSDGVVTPIADGDCNITATSDAASDSCSVNVSFIRYDVTKNITGGQLSNNINNVIIGESYTDTIVPDEGYSIKNAVISITVGGEDITDSCYSNGTINILDVDGDIEINVQCVQVPIYTIIRNLTGCTSNSDIQSIGEGNPHTEIITQDNGYTLNEATVSITMGGADISSSYSNGRISIPEVTGNIVIEIVAVEDLGNMPVVDMQCTDVTDNLVRNLGTGGTTYDSSVVGQYTSDAGGLHLISGASVSVPYATSLNNSFTWIVRGGFDIINTNTYQRLCRGDQDVPSIFYRPNGDVVCAKLTGSSSGTRNNYNDFPSWVSGQNNYQLNRSDVGMSQHVYIWVYDADNGTVSFYFNGKLAATQTGMKSYGKTAASLCMGNNDTPDGNTYYAVQITISLFRIYNFAMTEDEIANLSI